MTANWHPLTAETVAALPAQLGVFELRDADGVTVQIGYAGGLESFGLRSALGHALTAVPAGVEFRIEYTHAYLTTWTERLMQYKRDHGLLPAANLDDDRHLGSLSKAGPPRSAT